MARWLIDRDHSCASFAVRHMALAKVRGQFNVSGVIEFDPEDRSRTVVNVEIEVASVNTSIRKRDEHLLTADFFDAARFPLITFLSTEVRFTGSNRCHVTGDLTLHGVTRRVELDGEFAGPQGNPMGPEISIGFSGSTTVNREDFGMMWGSTLMQGDGFIIGREVQLFLDVEADREE